MVVDGQEQKQYDWPHIRSIVFSPDSQRLAYVAFDGDRPFLVVDGQEGQRYESIREGSVVFSPDSQRVAYVVGMPEEDGGHPFVVVDGQERQRCRSPYTGIDRQSTALRSPFGGTDQRCPQDAPVWCDGCRG